MVSKILVGSTVSLILPFSLALNASAGGSNAGDTPTSTTTPTTTTSTTNSGGTTGDSGFVTVVPSAAPQTLSTYYDSGSENLYYGTADDGTIGEENLTWSLNLNGRQVQIAQSFANVNNGLYPEPETAADLQWQCWTSGGALCVPPSGTLNEDTHVFGYSSSRVSYSYTSGDISTYSILPDVNGTYYIHVNWNWLALGYPNPSTSNGRFNATPVISAPIVCNYKLTTPCSFSQ